MGDRPNISDIFDHARLITSPDDREKYLNTACGDDAALRARVSALLAADENAGDFLKVTSAQGAQGIPGSAPSLFSANTSPGRDLLTGLAEGPGTIIGSYKLLQLIGEGGFGTVYLAEQERPVRRRVALKIIKLGMDTRQTLARFEAERQALAMMEHPNIARVLDAGATEQGRPYFVMELVRGVPITEFCDANCLTPDERLALFVAVCQAVQHAHQKGIIHRDIKPSNVLVSRHDETPVVKIIDFGIAKATDARLTEKTVFTEFHQMIGTPAYMSPEQAGQSDLDVDTRSDVYSLGVLLYELLTGATPFDVKSLMSAGYAEIQRIIREVDPPRPSTRLSTMKDVLPGIAANRKTEPARLTRLVRGDLDWIVMKCLEKDRSRRYETANGLGADVARYLAGEPVAAAPPSNAYRVRKFVRRHRVAVLASAAILGALTAGLAFSVVGYLVANRARTRAQAAEGAEREARLAAQTQRQRADTKAEELRQELYIARIQRIQHVIESGGNEPVKPLLEACDLDLRGWEWDWLHRLSDRSETTFVAHDHNSEKFGTIAYSADGRRFMTTGDRGLLRVWDGKSHRMLLELPDPGGPCVLRDAAFAEDGVIAVVGTNNGAARIWNLNSGEVVRSFKTDDANLRSVAISPDGALVAAGTWFGPTIVWNSKTGERIHTLESPADRGASLKFTPDGSKLLVGSLDNMVSVIDMKSGTCISSNRGSAFVVLDAAMSPDGRKIASIGQDAKLWVREVESGKLSFSVSTGMGSIRKLAFNPHDGSIAVAGAEGAIKFFDADSGEELGLLSGHESGITDISFDPRGPQLLSFDEKGVVKLWHLGSVPTQHQSNVGFELHAIGFYGDGRSICAGGADNGLTCLDTGSLEKTNSVVLPIRVIVRIAVSRDGRRIAAIGRPDIEHPGHWMAAIFDDRQAVLQQWPCAGDGILTFSSDSKSVVTTEADGSAGIHDVQTGETIQRVKATGRRLVRAVLDADSNMLILGDDVGDIHVANARTGSIVHSFAAHPRMIKDMALDRTSNALVTACNRDTAMRVWDWKNSTLIRTIPVAQGVISVDVSPDGRRLIAGGRDMTLRMWDMRTGRFILTIGQHSMRIERVVFSADGSTIASCSLDHFLKVWKTGRPSIANLNLRYSRAVESRNKLQTMNIEPGGD